MAIKFFAVHDKLVHVKVRGMHSLGGKVDLSLLFGVCTKRMTSFHVICYSLHGHQMEVTERWLFPSTREADQTRRLCGVQMGI